MFMRLRTLLAALALVGLVAGTAPPAPALANGVASTRNILLLGGAAAAYLIIQHNRKVHERNAERAREQAQASEQRNDMDDAYRQEHHAYVEELAANAQLQREVAYQHRVIGQQRAQLAAFDAHDTFATSQDGAVAYGWGSI